MRRATSVQPVITDVPGAPAHLGQTIEIYRQGAPSHITFATRLLVWLTVVVGSAWLYFGWQRDTWGLWLAVFLIGFVSIPIVPAFLRYAQQWHDAAVLYERGIAYYHRGACRTFEWAEITEVIRKKQSVNVGSSGGDLFDFLMPLVRLLAGERRQYAVRAGASTPLEIGGTLTEVEHLMDAIERCSDHRSKLALAKFKTGAEVSFGAVSASLHNGIRTDGTWHPWDHVSIVGGHIHIEDPTKWFATRVKILRGDVPNWDVLRSLVDYSNDPTSADVASGETL